jgi:anti-anti-sigma factor
MSLELRDLVIQKEETKISSTYIRVIYTFQGELSDYNSYMLRTHMEQWLDMSFAEYIIDLKPLNSLDIAGMNLLVQLQEELVSKGAVFTVIAPFKKKVMETIYLTKLTEALNIEYFLDNEFDD